MKIKCLAFCIFLVGLTSGLLTNNAVYAQQNLEPQVKLELDAIERTVETIQQSVTATSVDDELIDARTRLIELQPKIDASFAPIEKRLISLNSRLETFIGNVHRRLLSSHSTIHVRSVSFTRSSHAGADATNRLDIVPIQLNALGRMITHEKIRSTAVKALGHVLHHIGRETRVKAVHVGKGVKVVGLQNVSGHENRAIRPVVIQCGGQDAPEIVQR